MLVRPNCIYSSLNNAVILVIAHIVKLAMHCWLAKSTKVQVFKLVPRIASFQCTQVITKWPTISLLYLLSKWLQVKLKQNQINVD